MDLRQKHPRRQGDLGEAAAIHWLTAAGAAVPVPLFHSPDYDLLAEAGGRILRVQVKTSAYEKQPGKFGLQLATNGGNQSWSGLVKRFGASRCDYLFALVADGRRWFIPASEVEGTTAIVLGGEKYSEFEVGDGDLGRGPSRIAIPTRGSVGAGEPSETVNLVPRAEGVRIPPPPFRSVAAAGEGRVGRARISANHQLTIPRAPFEQAELEVGDGFRVEAVGPGQLTLTRLSEFAAAHEAPLQLGT